MTPKKRIILVASVGKSPQVLTEMVWELAHREDLLIPDEIVVIATKKHAENLKAKLLDGGEKSVWSKMLSALAQDKVKIDGRLRFGTASIAIVPDSRGNEMSDLRSGDDGLLAADFILGQLRRFTESSDTIVLASIAGGRKTMSALMFSCMTLVGRSDDKILHVLLPPEIEGGSAPPFYYPQKGMTYTSQTGRKYKWNKLRSELIDIPFVRTRGWYHQQFGTSSPSYRTLVGKIEKNSPPAVVYPRIVIDVWNGFVLVDGKEVCMSRAAFAVLVLAASGQNNSREMLVRLSEAHKNRNGNACQWVSEFMLGRRFSGDGAKMLDDFSRVTNELRKALKKGGLGCADALVTTRSRPIRFDLTRIEWRGKSKFSEICGYLLPGAHE